MPDARRPTPVIAVVGAGPAGLMAAQVCADAGAKVDVYDAMPSVGRKFLLAGKGGLNLTHSEPAETFRLRYGEALPRLRPLLDAFGPTQLREWVHGLGIETFVGSSGRVFPREMKAAPLLRAWLRRLRAGGVGFHSRLSWDGGLDLAAPNAPQAISLRFAAGCQPTRRIECDAVVLALGGGSWPRLGSDGRWQQYLSDLGVPLVPLQPANCGFDCGWGGHFSDRWAGSPVKSVAASVATPPEEAPGAPLPTPRRGEFVVTSTGIEGSLVYGFSSAARRRLARGEEAALIVDLLPDRSSDWVLQAMLRPRGGRSLSNQLRRMGIDGVKAALLRECLCASDQSDASVLASSIKALQVRLLAARPLAEAISSAGGVRLDALDERLMVRTLPGVFCAGEMLDWEAPTGGYLLTACFATGRAAGLGAIEWHEGR